MGGSKSLRRVPGQWVGGVFMISASGVGFSVGGTEGESPGGADVDAGVDEGEGIVGQVELDRLELFAAAAAKAGCIEDKKRAIAAKLCGVVEKLIRSQAEVVLGIEAQEGPGRIGGAAAQAGADGNIFIQVYMDGREGWEISLKEAPGFEAEVVGGVAGDGETVNCKTGFGCGSGG